MDLRQFNRGTITPNQDDWSTESGARRLGEKIRQFWKDRGYDINIWIESLIHHPASGSTVWNVKSDLLNGLPR